MSKRVRPIKPASFPAPSTTVPHRKLVIILCSIAAARVLVFGAAFPFFNNVDEQAHVDLVMKYARGQVPHELGRFSSESAEYFALYGTPEYLTSSQSFPGGQFPAPVWTLPVDERRRAVETNKAWWEANKNHESSEPPLYYMVAGAWLNLGRACGISGGGLLYWIRSLDVFVSVALVWIGFEAANSVFPNRQFIVAAVPLFLAVWPQSVFYSVQSDVFSPLFFGLTFVGLIKFLQADLPRPLPAAGTGLALAATCLVKTTNMPLLAVAGAALIFKARQLLRAGQLGKGLPSLCLLAFSAAVPITLWLAWNVYIFGDLTATGAKTEFLGWTRKPVGNWVPHPIFTLHGLKEFWPELVASFWRGELVWRGHRLASIWVDAFYWISSTLALGWTAFSLLRPDRNLSGVQRRCLWLALWSFTVLVLFNVLLSIGFDFGECVYPSAQHPYFTSGRLLAAAAVPFFLVYAYLVDRSFGQTSEIWPRMILLGGIAGFLAISQVVVNGPAFSSHYNFFHLAGSLDAAR